MRTIISLRALAVLAGAAVILGAAHLPAQAQTKITVGKILGGVGLHIPSYVAMDRGFFKDEGLDARFVSLVGRPMITAGLSGNLDFVPIPSGGAQAVLSGAKLRYVVGQSLKPQWIIVTGANVNTPQDLKGKTLGYARAGAADYDEGAAVLQRAFKMEVGKDYKVISFQGETDRIAALINGDIAGALLSIPHAAKAATAGMKILIRTGDYIPRAGGTIWARQEFIEQNPEATKKFIRATAKAVMFFRSNKDGSVQTLKKYLSINSDDEAVHVWEQLRDTFGAELPPNLFAQIIESRVETMKAARQWPEGRPMPDPGPSWCGKCSIRP